MKTFNNNINYQTAVIGFETLAIPYGNEELDENNAPVIETVFKLNPPKNASRAVVQFITTGAINGEPQAGAIVSVSESGEVQALRYPAQPAVVIWQSVSGIMLFDNTFYEINNAQNLHTFKFHRLFNATLANQLFCRVQYFK
ncbi:MAG: hypothetical protein KF900_11465 [Bacteroidetes bacterium]|nr:hypothetical protein [Bacteroidota bacterium]